MPLEKGLAWFVLVLHAEPVDQAEDHTRRQLKVGVGNAVAEVRLDLAHVEGALLSIADVFRHLRLPLRSRAVLRSLFRI